MIIGYKNNTPQKISIKRPCQGYYLRWYYNGWHYWFFLPGKLSLITEGEKYRTLGTRSVMMGTGQITYEQCQAIRTIMNTREVHVLTADGWKNVRIEPGSLIVYGNQVNGYDIELAVKIGSKEISISGFSPIADIPVIPIPDSGLCEVIIGTQVWMCKNYDSDFPGSKVYNNDEANRVIYGGLYTYDQIMSPGFCPAGWHVPSLAEWNTLIDYVGDISDAGGILKEAGTTHWDTPNTGAVDTYGLSLLPGGLFLSIVYANKGITGFFWTKTGVTNDNLAYSIRAINNSAALTIFNLAKNVTDYASVRLIKDTPATPFNDWFLPSKDELNLMKVELYDYSVGGFSEVDTYWSSSEFDSTTAWNLNFFSNIWGDLQKQNLQFVRACRAFTSTTNYNLRDVGPAGGWIFWKSGNDYLEAAPTDQSVSQVWSNIINIEIGTTGTAIGTGQANTTAIIAQAGHTTSAAKLCDDLIT